MYVGTDSVYTLTSQYERDATCPICSAGVLISLPKSFTLQQTIDAIVSHKDLQKLLSYPSISHGMRNVYMRGALEASTKLNLVKTLDEIFVGMEDVVLTVNDKKLAAPLRVRLRLLDGVDHMNQDDNDCMQDG